MPVKIMKNKLNGIFLICCVARVLYRNIQRNEATLSIISFSD
jgi:hypothetical protein